ARVANERRMRLMRCRKHHVRQLIFILWRQGDAVGHRTYIRNVEKSMVRRAVLWREPGSIHAEDHGQVLQGGVVYDAIISALQKGGINSANGVKTHRCHAAGKQ